MKGKVKLFHQINSKLLNIELKFILYYFLNKFRV